MRMTFTGGPVLICMCCVVAPFACVAAEHKPPLMHARSYDAQESIDLARYWVSEKMDGVRAYWNGKHLLTRAGNVIAAPVWFTRGWPSLPMDGELWAGRGTFERVSGIVRKDVAQDAEWGEISYRVFDLPSDGVTFDERYAMLSELLARVGIDWLSTVEQIRLSSLDELRSKLEAIEAIGGEGLMLHRGDSLYVAARTNELIKYKSFADAEATVVGYVAGNGKYEGLMGALIVEREDGTQFKLGSGFTDDERRNPPPLGSSVTYAFNGVTSSGLPRFARFLRIRRIE